jgi:type III secretion protein J
MTAACPTLPSGASRAGRSWLALCLALLLALGGCGSKVELFGALNEREANDVLATLMRAGIAAEKVVGKNNVSAIRVEQSGVTRAIELLNAAGLPRDRHATIGELFRREGLISSPAEERVRYMYGISQELARTLTSIDGVLNARVHLVLPNNDPGSAARPSSAAVLIRHSAGALVETIVPRIKELVVNSIEGMSYDRVSVVLVRATEDWPAVPAAAPAQAAPAEGLLAELPVPLPLLVYGLAGGLVLALLGNVGLLVVVLRRRAAKRDAAPMVPATT